jgi:hypothetical protein
MVFVEYRTEIICGDTGIYREVNEPDIHPDSIKIYVLSVSEGVFRRIQVQICHRRVVKIDKRA